MTWKRLAALAAAVLMIGLAIAAFVMAIAGAPANYLMAVVYSLVAIPIFAYACVLAYRLLNRRGSQKDAGDNENPSRPEADGDETHNS